MVEDEAGGKIIEKFVRLRERLCSYKILEGKEEKKCKGIKRAVIEKNITHDDYKECLKAETCKMRKMIVIRSHGHEVTTEIINKMALSANDDQRIVREDRISTFAHGHYSSMAPPSKESSITSFSPIRHSSTSRRIINLQKMIRTYSSQHLSKTRLMIGSRLLVMCIREQIL